MFLAIVLLLAALIVVLVKDRHFWFGAGDTASTESDVVEDAASPTHSAASAKKDVPKATKPKTHTVAKAATEQPAEMPGIVATNRTALPPLEVEVVAGGTRRKVHPGSSSVKVEIPPDSAGSPGSGSLVSNVQAGGATNAAEHVRMSPDTAQAVERTVEPTYPVLARQMKVQGSVVMQALIGTDGLIQDLHVLSGPGILASAAQEAVRQWRFKPYMQNGRAVETEAKITVNFTISTF